MRSFRCLHGYHSQCGGKVFFGNILQPQSTWELVGCRCDCHREPLPMVEERRKVA